MPFPCRSPAAHTLHAATLPFPDSAVSFVKVRVVDGNIRTASLLLVTTFVEIRVVSGRSRTRAGRPHTVTGRPMLIHTYHAVLILLPCRAVPWPWEVAFRKAWSWHGRARHGHGMACVNQTRPHCVNQIGKKRERHGVCELALMKLMWIRFVVTFVNQQAKLPDNYAIHTQQRRNGQWTHNVTLRCVAIMFTPLRPS
jgi:hypothetical protein